MNKKILFILKWIIALTILFILFKKVGFLNIYLTVLNINLFLFLIALLFFIIQLLLGMVTLKILLDLIKKIRYKSFFKHYFNSWSIGLFAPSKMGELSIGWFLEKEGIPLGQGLMVYLIDKIITIFFLSIIGLIGVFWFFGRIKAIYSFLILLVLFLLLFLYSNKFKNIIRKYILRKYEKRFTGFSKTLPYYLKFGKRLLLINAIITIIRSLIGWLSVYFLFLSLGEKVPLLLITLIMTISWLSGLIPITIDGLGVKQSITLFLFSQIGVSQPIILANQAILIVLNYSIASLFLLKYLILHKSN